MKLQNKKCIFAKINSSSFHWEKNFLGTILSEVVCVAFRWLNPVHSNNSFPLFCVTLQAVDAVGEILLSLSYLPTAERLTVVVAKCKNLVWTNNKTTAGQKLSSICWVVWYEHVFLSADAPVRLHILHSPCCSCCCQIRLSKSICCKTAGRSVRRRRPPRGTTPTPSSTRPWSSQCRPSSCRYGWNFDLHWPLT